MEKAIGEWRFAYQAGRMAMLIGNVHPSTIEGLKRLAAQYRKQQGVKHHTALDLAAKAAHCANYKHALRILPAREGTKEHLYVLLTVYWCDKENGYQIGRETLKIELEKSIPEICSISQLKKIRGFRSFRMVAPDHFVADDVANSQSYARGYLMTAERSLRFMERTGLRPSRARTYGKVYRNARVASGLPSRDHATEWVDPANDQFILVDEPYGNAPDETKRAAWAERNGWCVVKTSWPGMYSPYDCDLYVVTDDRVGYDVDALVATINSMPAPLLETDWYGSSSSSWETFTSPMAETPQDTRRARCRGMIYPIATKTTLPYSYNRGTKRRRPAGVMPIEGHTEAGSIIKAVLLSGQCPYGVFHRLNSVRSTLEDWMGLEIGRGQLDGREFFDVYYSETESDARNKERALLGAGIIEILDELKWKLRAAYPDCAPLRQQIHQIDMSISLMGGLKTDKN